MNNTKNIAIKGVFWSSVERFSVQLIQFIISIILARLLLPTDFGMIAIVLVFIRILQTINQVGFGAALIQKLDRDDLDFSSVFVLNIILGLLLYVILYIFSPIIAQFFQQPKLIYLIRLIGINLISTSLSVVQRTKLIIKVDFKTQARISLFSVIISGGLGLYFAYKGLGVMALVIQSLLYNIFDALFLWLFVKWKPSIRFSFDRFLGLFKYAYKLIISRLINNIFQEIYPVIIGKVYSPTQLGYFNRAKSFYLLSTNNITGIVQRVSTPLLCEAQKNYDQMKNILLRFISSTAIIVYPLLFGLFVLAKPLILVLLTEKWISSVWILKYICPAGIFYVISTFNQNIYNATGRTDLALQSEIIKKSIFVILILLSIKFGFKILVLSQLIIAFVEFIVDTLYTKKQIGLSVFRQILNVSKILLASSIMGISVALVTYFISSNILKLIIGVFVGAILYIIICYLMDINSIRNVINKINIKGIFG